MIRLYNTLTKKVEEFKPIKDGEARIYTCGPTVYDHAHIGNLSSYIYADTLRRVLEANGLKTKQAMNYTDVDDKTIKRSSEKYPELDPKEALKKLTDQFIELFLSDIKKVGVDTNAIDFVKATDSIDGMQRLILQLLDKKIAYIAEDGIYLSIEAYRKSGKTYGQLLKISESSTSEARIDNDEYDKESVHDFVLWKKQKDGEPAWKFEVDGKDMAGRPGWHIECSAMSEGALGLPFDLHTGGIDLIFPHHENEIAQSTGAKDSPVMAKYFVHSNHLLVDGKKMAKSANNFYTLQDITDKGYDPLAFRLLVLQSHYKSESNFTWDNLESAQNRLKSLQAWADLRFQSLKVDPTHVSPLTVEQFGIGLRDRIYNDLDTPRALSLIYEKGLLEITDKYGFKETDINQITEYLDGIFGLRLGSSEDITKEQKQLIIDREQARKDQDWPKSDQLRDKLVEQGIGIKDTDHGSIWYRL